MSCARRCAADLGRKGHGPLRQPLVPDARVIRRHGFGSGQISVWIDIECLGHMDTRLILWPSMIAGSRCSGPGTREPPEGPEWTQRYASGHPGTVLKGVGKAAVAPTPPGSSPSATEARSIVANGSQLRSGSNKSHLDKALKKRHRASAGVSRFNRTDPGAPGKLQARGLSGTLSNVLPPISPD